MEPANPTRARRTKWAQFGMLYLVALVLILIPHTASWAIPDFLEGRAAANAAGNAATRIESAQEALVHGRLDEAIANADEALLGIPASERARALKANALFERYWENKADTDLAAGRQLATALSASKESAAYIARGNLALIENSAQRAVTLLSEAVKASPDDPYAHHQLGFALNQSNRPDQALTHFRRALELAPNMAWVQNNLTETMTRLERCEESVPGWKPEFAAECSERIGIARYNAQRFDDARRLFERAATLAPGNGLYQANYAAVLLQGGDRDRAVEHARRAQGLGVKDHPIFRPLGIQ